MLASSQFLARPTALCSFCIKDKANNPLLHSEQEPAQVLRPKNWLKAIDFGCSQQLPGGMLLCSTALHVVMDGLVVVGGGDL